MAKVERIPRVLVFAGPNGSGKSSHANAILEKMNIDIFVNADYIARGLSGKKTETVNFEAGRIMLKRLNELAASKQDFAFESTLSALTFAKFLNDLKRNGYLVTIVYFWLKNAKLAYSI